MELSKKDKRVAREIIEMGVQKEFAKGLYDADTVLQQWKNKSMNNRDAYHLLFKTIDKFDNHIARRYNGMTGSKYIFIIAWQLFDGIISIDDLKDFSPEVIEGIKLIANK